LRFIVTGGGTGGHIYPALAIAEGLTKRFPACQVVYAGTAQGLEADIVPRAGFEFRKVPAMGLKRGLYLQNLQLPWRVLSGYREAKLLLREIAPLAVIGTGGYVCGPVILAASRMKIPSIIHEQNALPGITNRILSRLVDRAAVTFEESVAYFNKSAAVTITGLPVRTEILSTQRIAARKKMNLEPDKLLLLSFGGSQGSRTLNRAMAELFSLLETIPKLHLLHITGKGQYAAFSESISLPDNVRVEPYIYNMAEALAAADLAVCRAGATTLAEITVRGLPALLIPFPFATDNHQEYNARALVAKGAADILLDSELNGAALLRWIKSFIDTPSRLSAMSTASKALGKPQALDDILALIQEII